MATNEDLAENVAEILADMGHDPMTVSDGHTALEMLPTADLLLTEIALPDMDALELLRSTRRAHPHLPIVVLTSYAPEEKLRAAEDAGADAVLSFPFHGETFERVLQAELDHALSRSLAAKAP